MFAIQNRNTLNFVDFDSERGDGHVVEDKKLLNHMKYHHKSKAEEDVLLLEQICNPQKYVVVEA